MDVGSTRRVRGRRVPRAAHTHKAESEHDTLTAASVPQCSLTGAPQKPGALQLLPCNLAVSIHIKPRKLFLNPLAYSTQPSSDALAVDTRGGVTPAHWPRCVVGGKRGGGDGKGSAPGDDRSGRQLVMSTVRPLSGLARDSRTPGRQAGGRTTRFGEIICRVFLILI